MSQENVEPARLGIELFNRGDVAAFVDQYDPDVVFHTSVDNPDVDTYSARQAVAALGAAWREMFAVPHSVGLRE
jgi:ketosteroid isomerase-like protein